MSEHIHKTLELVVAQIRQHEEQAAQKKQMANNLCDLAGIAHMYPDDQSTATMLRPLAPDGYYGNELATVVVEVLERRKLAGLGAPTANDIYDSMTAGGYDFVAMNDANAKQALYVSLSEMTSALYRLPNGTYGLQEPYPSTNPAVPDNVSGQTSERVEKDQAAGDDGLAIEIAESCVGLPR